MEKQVKLFLDFLKDDKKLSDNTLQSYRRDIEQYEKYVSDNKINYLKVTEETILEYMEYLREENKKESTISRSLASIRSFYQYLIRVKKIKKDPTMTIESPKINKRTPNILTSKEVELLLDQPKDVDLKGTRDKAMLEFAYATGMRVTEMISLDIDDVKLDEGYVVCRGRSKSRNIPLGSMSLKALKEYIDDARPYLIRDESEEALFVNVNGTRLTRQGFWKIVKYYKKPFCSDRTERLFYHDNLFIKKEGYTLITRKRISHLSLDWMNYFTSKPKYLTALL